MVIVTAKKEKKPRKEKETAPSFVLTLKLNTEKYQEDILDKRRDIGRRIYNACLNELGKRYVLMTQSKKYQGAINLPAKTEKEKRNQLLREISKKYKLTEYSMHKFVKPIQHHYSKNIDAFTAQKIATRCLKAFKGQIYHTAKKVHFKKYGEMNSLEGKSNSAGIRFRGDIVYWNGLSIKVSINPKDEYAQMALMLRIKYCRILRRGTKYYLQLIIEGIPPVKIDKETGEFRHKIGNSKVGLDIGPQTLGDVSDNEANLLELAPEINTPYKEISRIQRKMDRSRRENNPGKYNSNGTINRNNKDKWIKSKNCLKLQHKLQKKQGKLKDIRRQSHNRLANEIISQGIDVYVETMSFKGLQKRAKKSTKNKNGKINSKKRFGKSLANKAPASFLTILDNKLKWQGAELHRIETAQVKASQYNHEEDVYIKKELSERWTMIGADRIQRDLYSAFLIMNVNPDLSTINREQCLEKYDKFKTLHNLEIARLRTSTNRRISSMGI